MVCQFCDVTFVYGESLQWGFGFYLLLLYRMCNRIQGRTPVFGSCLVLIHQTFVADVDQIDIRIVCRDPSDAGVWGGFVILWLWFGFSSDCWFLKWTMIGDWSEFDLWSKSFVEIHQILVSEVDLLFFVDIVWDPSEFCFWSGSWWCRPQNLLLLIRFQHEGVCEAWTPGSWLPWWTI